MFARAFAKAHKIANDHAARLKAARGRERGIFAAKKDTRGELFIYEQIGESFWGGGVSAKSVIDQLEKLKGVSQLDIRINSEGGDVFDGKAIYNALRRFAANKNGVHRRPRCLRRHLHRHGGRQPSLPPKTRPG
jgi:ATP-dependent protease ClpP protease subunit